MPEPDQAATEIKVQASEKPAAPKPVEIPKQPLGQTEAEMVKTIDSLGDGHTPDPDRSFRAILNFPILGKLREVGNRFKSTKRETLDVNSEEINQLQRDTDVKTETI